MICICLCRFCNPIQLVLRLTGILAAMRATSALVQTAVSEVLTTGEASRVAQLDAFRLDAELVAIVMDRVNLLMTETPPVMRGLLSTVLGKLIRTAIAVGSVLHSGRTPGMGELGLCFSSSHGSQRASAGVLPFIALQHVLPEVWLQIRHAVAAGRLRASASESSQPWGWACVANLERLTLLSSLLNMRLTRTAMAHVDPNEGRTVSFEYLNQQLVWGELQHFVMFLLPLLTPGSLAANSFLASATARLLRIYKSPGLQLKRQAGAVDVCCLCSTEHILVAVETQCCGSRCCYMCAQRYWQLEQKPRCPVCAALFSTVHLQPIHAEPED